MYYLCLTSFNLKYLQTKERLCGHFIKFRRNSPTRCFLQQKREEFHFDYNSFRFLDKTQHRSLYNSTSDKRTYDKKIVILTPVSKAGKTLGHFFNMICSLNYPYELIPVTMCSVLVRFIMFPSLSLKNKRLSMSNLCWQPSTIRHQITT